MYRVLEHRLSRIATEEMFAPWPCKNGFRMATIGEPTREQSFEQYEPPRVLCSQVVWLVAMMAGVFEACQLVSRSRGGMWPISP
jgi:hypothetical protein